MSSDRREFLGKAAAVTVGLGAPASRSRHNLPRPCRLRAPAL